MLAEVDTFIHICAALPLGIALHTPNYLKDPVRTYNDPINDRARISSDNRGRTIIYQWFNKVTGQIYVGSAVNGSTRLLSYFSPSKLKEGLRVYLSLLLHGHNNFTLVVLEDLGPTGSVSRADMLAREQFYLDILFAGPKEGRLNSSPTAGSSAGYKHTKAAKELMSAQRTGSVMSPKTRELLSTMMTGVNNPFYGQTHSQETLLAMSASKMGVLNPMYGRAKSAEFLAAQTRDKSGLNNPQYGVVKSASTIAKLTKLVHVYDSETLVLLGSHPTSQVSKLYSIGKDTLYKSLASGLAYKGRIYRRTLM